MSDGDFDEEAYQAYEDELYKDDSSTASGDELDSEIEEALYGSVHYASSLHIFPDDTPEKTAHYSTEETCSDKRQQQTHSTDRNTVHPVIVVDSSASESEGADDNLELQQLQVNENWDLDSKDLAVGSQLKSRYYKPVMDRTGKRCFNCNERGHLASNCPEPKKVSSCYLCGVSGHMRYRCPNQLCFNCDEPGHQSRNCRKPRKLHFIKCRRCFQQGHQSSDCPDHWRQYHLTTKAGKVVTPTKPVEIPQRKAYCYNCSEQGHYGHECVEDRMEGSSTGLPFVAQYDGCPTPTFHGNHTASHYHNNNQKRHSWPQEQNRQEQDRQGSKKHWHPDTPHGRESHNNHRRDWQRQQQQPSSHQVSQDERRTVEFISVNKDRHIGDGYPSPSSNRKRFHQEEQSQPESTHGHGEPRRKKKKNKKQKQDNQVFQRTVEVLNQPVDKLHGGHQLEQQIPMKKVKKYEKRGRQQYLSHLESGIPSKDHPPMYGHQFVSERGFIFNRSNSKKKKKRFTK